MEGRTPLRGQNSTPIDTPVSSAHGVSSISRTFARSTQLDLSGKNVLITGASRGIGAGLARAFGAEGARVIGAARSVESVAEVVKPHGGVAVSLDAANLTDVDGFIDRVEQEHGPIDVLINNAGIEVSSLFEDMTPEQINQLITVNLLAPM